MNYLIIFIIFHLTYIVASEHNFPNSIAVFCASSNNIDPEYKKLANDLGIWCAQHNIKIIFGGANSGLMGILADAALSHGGILKGILPELGREWNVAHSGIQELLFVSDIYYRYQAFDQADAYIILPGGIGTLAEAIHMIAQKQYGVHKKPIIFINQQGFFDNLFAYFNCLVQENVMKPEHLNLFTVITSLNELPDALTKAPDGFLDHTTQWWKI